jgi:hypothetical protein
MFYCNGSVGKVAGLEAELSAGMFPFAATFRHTHHLSGGRRELFLQKKTVERETGRSSPSRVVSNEWRVGCTVYL